MIITFLLLVLLFRVVDLKKKWIEAWMKSVIVWVALAFYSLEILSLFTLVTKNSLMIFWGCLSVLLMGMIILLHKKRRRDFNIAGELKRLFYQIWKYKLFCLFSILLIFLSILTVPYNWDSMTYHLSRIANWAQNQ